MSKSTKNITDSIKQNLQERGQRLKATKAKANELNDEAKAFSNSTEALLNQAKAEKEQFDKFIDAMTPNFLKSKAAKTKVAPEIHPQEESNTIDLNAKSDAIMSNNPTKDQVNNKIKSNSTQDKNDQNLNSGSMWGQIKKVAKYIYQIPSKAMQYASNMFAPKAKSDVTPENIKVSSNQQPRTTSQSNNKKPSQSLQHSAVVAPKTPYVAKVNDKNRSPSKF